MFPRNKQTGSALVIAIFIIVVMSLITAATINIISRASGGVVTEVYGARALNAARSGIEMGAAQILPLDEEFNKNVCGNRLSSSTTGLISGQPFETAGLQNCEISVRCSQLETSSPIDSFSVRLTSTGVCTVGDQQYSRELLVEIYDLTNN